jgi:hypothetical protein
MLVVSPTHQLGTTPLASTNWCQLHPQLLQDDTCAFVLESDVVYHHAVLQL